MFLPTAACTVAAHYCTIFLDYFPWLERRLANSVTMFYLASDQDNIIVDFPIDLSNSTCHKVLVTVQTLVVLHLFLGDKASCVQQIIHQIRVAIKKMGIRS
jgi:hypothetical protein